MDQLVPLALAAIMYCDSQNYVGQDWPDVRTAATMVEMWFRSIVMSAKYLNRIGLIWHTDEDAQLERQRRALIDAVQLLNSVADGTATAELLRLQGQLGSIACMLRTCSNARRKSERLTQYAAALQRRLDAAHARR